MGSVAHVLSIENKGTSAVIRSLNPPIIKPDKELLCRVNFEENEALISKMHEFGIYNYGMLSPYVVAAWRLDCRLPEDGPGDERRFIYLDRHGDSVCFYEIQKDHFDDLSFSSGQLIANVEKHPDPSWASKDRLWLLKATRLLRKP